MQPLKGHKHSRIIKGQRHFWLVKNLIEKAKGLKPFELPVDGVTEVDMDCWFGATKEPTIRRVIDHCRRIEAADLRYPVILNVDGSLMDGGHRIAKAILQGDKYVSAVQFNEIPEPDWIEAA